MTPPIPKDESPESFSGKLKISAVSGLKKGWSGLIWLLKILIPISFLTALMVHYRLLYHINFLLEPLMSLIHLPAAAAVVLVIGLFTGIYGTVAALSVMPFSMDHMILIAIFTLISHNLIQEGLVQAKSGLNFFVASGFRLSMSFIVTFICGLIMGVSPDVATTIAQTATHTPIGPLLPMLTDWAADTGRLCIQIFCIIMPLMVAMAVAKTFNVIEKITRTVSPMVSLMGLDKSSGMLWITAAVFGLAYGSAVIVAETQSGQYEKSALTKLHLSIGVNHAMIEDPALFLPLGLPMLWLWVPRLLAAFTVAWLYGGFSFLRRCYAQRAGHKKLCDH
ncbi:MAG: iron transporter [Desulfobacterales bacterium]|nr:MAG: iron transporter [Desulfobacterales bacterium]